MSKMSQTVIRCEQLKKRYRIGERERYRTLRDTIAATFRVKHRRREPHEFVWALDGITLDVRQSEVLGVIGRNGAGKTTLLKILSRITKPTSGRALVRGRLGALLEVGTGFHPELTGRENIYLNGAILGMPRRDIDRRFDEIVDFAEISRFLDTPVKRYSTGMYMRLAFSVSAHLEPDILVVDEVLAVGDAAFQKKCLGKMGDVAHAGRTVILVSHNLTAVSSMCSSAIWIDQGRIVEQGSAPAVVRSYLRQSSAAGGERLWTERDSAPGNEHVRLRRVAVRPAIGEIGGLISVRTPIELEIEYWNLVPDAHLNLSAFLHNEEGVLIFNTGDVFEDRLPSGLFRYKCLIPGDLLNDGRHSVDVALVKNGGYIIHKEDRVIVFDVEDDSHARGSWYGDWEGAVRPVMQWSRERVAPETIAVETEEREAITR